MGIRTRDRNRTGWRIFLDPGMWFRSLLLTAVFVVSLSALACVVGLVRDTTGHDWHASGKLFWAETLLALHFDPRAPVRYRTRKGAEVTLPRGELLFNGEALLARDRLLHTAKGAAGLGAWCGFGGALLCLALVWCYEAERGDRRTPQEPRRRSPGSASPTPEAMAPVRTPTGPDAPRPRKQQPAGANRREEAPAPAPRKREYGRWI